MCGTINTGALRPSATNSRGGLGSQFPRQAHHGRLGLTLGLPHRLEALDAFVSPLSAGEIAGPNPAAKHQRGFKVNQWMTIVRAQGRAIVNAL